jgi:hypothetical protein
VRGLTWVALIRSCVASQASDSPTFCRTYSEISAGSSDNANSNRQLAMPTSIWRTTRKATAASRYPTE